MNLDHLSDFEIQQYSFDRPNCETSVVNHIESCDSCLAKVNEYKAISGEIKNSQAPVFDFNLAALVLAKIPKAKPVTKSRVTPSLVYFLVFVLVALFCVAIFLLQGYITSAFTDIPPFVYYMVAVSAIFIAVSQVIEIYKKFQHKMNLLNLY